MIWSKADVELLHKLWFAGGSASACGRELGRGRNAVIGKVHRCGWTGQRALGHKSPRMPPRAKLPKPKKNIPGNIPEPAKQPLPSFPAAFTYSLLDLRPGQCRWPQGDGPFLFCGARQDEGGPYCREHEELAHQGPVVRARTQEWALPRYR